MTGSYETARRLFESAYANVMAEQPPAEEARRARAEIVTRMQVQAVAHRVPDAIRPVLNGRAAAYQTIIDEAFERERSQP